MVRNCIFAIVTTVQVQVDTWLCPTINCTRNRYLSPESKTHVSYCVRAHLHCASVSMVRQSCGLKLCSHLTFAFAFVLTSLSSLTLCQWKRKHAQKGSEPILDVFHWHNVKLDGDVDANANVKCEHSLIVLIVNNGVARKIGLQPLLEWLPMCPMRTVLLPSAQHCCRCLLILALSSIRMQQRESKY